MCSAVRDVGAEAGRVDEVKTFRDPVRAKRRSTGRVLRDGSESCGNRGTITRTKQIIEEALTLPVEERTLLADSLQRSFKALVSGMDAERAEEARRRLLELKSGGVMSVPADEIFEKALQRLRSKS